jgi:kynurenine formamidase
LGAARAADTGSSASLGDALAVLQSHHCVELTHAFAPGIPHCKGASDETVKALYRVEKDGTWINEYCHVGQWDTHVDAPAHFHAALHTVDAIDRVFAIAP